jgi:alkane 1-monooxygenase
MGLCCGVLGINVAHELGHRTNRRDQFLAWSLLATSLYMHFFVEHNYGHHRNVGTPDDPSSARPGESLYRFLPRTLITGAVSAYRLGQQRAKGRLLHNLTVRFWGFQALLVLLVALIAGPDALLAFLGAAAFGAVLLETVNYIEHYGLTRKKISGSRYEDPNAEHSWNSNHWVGRAMLFNLSRHSDHHAHPHRPYPILRHLEESPQMPTGYPGMMLLALFPPLFKLIIQKNGLSFKK